jgi:hypothetical protein
MKGRKRGKKGREVRKGGGRRFESARARGEEGGEGRGGRREEVGE